MKSKWILFNILFLGSFFSLQKVQAQYRISGKTIHELKQEKVSFNVPSLPTNHLLGPIQNVSSQKSEFFQLTSSKIPNVYSFDELGMFCKFEVKIEKATRFPVKIRLGEVEAVDRKEGKWQYDNWRN